MSMNAVMKKWTPKQMTASQLVGKEEAKMISRMEAFAESGIEFVRAYPVGFSHVGEEFNAWPPKLIGRVQYRSGDVVLNKTFVHTIAQHDMRGMQEEELADAMDVHNAWARNLPCSQWPLADLAEGAE